MIRLFLFVVGVLLVVAGIADEHPRNPIPVSVSHYEMTLGFVTVRVAGVMTSVGIFIVAKSAIT